VFAGAGWLVPGVIAAIAPHALFAWSEKRRILPPVALFGTVLLGFVFTMVVVEPATTFNGIPTFATFHAFGDDIGLASHVLRTAVVPVEPVGAALTLALVSIWMVATTADWLLRRLDATLGALGPSLVLFVAVAALGEGAHWPTTLLYGGAAAGFLLAEHYAELLERRTWFHLPRRRRSRLLGGGAVAAAIAVVTALVIGPLVPGARGEAWFDYRGLGDHGDRATWKTVTPLVDIRTRLIDQSDVELFTVRAERGAYWRLVGLDTFDGQVWGTEGEAPRVGQDIPDTQPAPPESVELVQQFDIGPLDVRWLPAAFRPQHIDLLDAHVITGSLTLVAESSQSNGAKYTVVSNIPTPTPAELRASLPVLRSRWQHYLALPDDFPHDVVDLARAVTRDAVTPYDKAIALQDYLRSDLFTYDINAATGHSDHALERFLFDTRTGYCEQFAGSYAAMARAIGLPARVAVGFTPGQQDADGVWHVTNKNAHAWPEVWLDGIGWLPFEPTPGRFHHVGADVEHHVEHAVAERQPTRPGRRVHPGRRWFTRRRQRRRRRARAHRGRCRGRRRGPRRRRDVAERSRREVGAPAPPPSRARRARPRHRRVGGSARPVARSRRRTAGVGDTRRVRAPPRARIRCRARGARAHGTRAAADRRALRARGTEQGRRDRRVEAGAPHRTRTAEGDALVAPLASSARPAVATRRAGRPGVTAPRATGARQPNVRERRGRRRTRAVPRRTRARRPRPTRRTVRPTRTGRVALRGARRGSGRRRGMPTRWRRR
jgi:hypothetical protein